MAVPAPPITPTAEPSRVSKPLQIDTTRPDVGGAPVITVPDESGKAKQMDAKTTFVLKEIVFENLTAFTPEELKADYADLLGTKVSLANLNAVAAKITTRYRNAGYILSRAVIPPQRITNGVVKIRIVEGYVNSVTFQGVPTTGLLGDYAEKIRNSKPLDAATLERYLLLINDLPGVEARAVLRPSATTPGASDVVVTVEEKKFDGSFTLDNRGSRYIGPLQGGVTLNANNMLGVYDRTQLRGVITNPVTELKFGQIVHEEQLGSEGTKVAFSAGYTHTHPGYLLEPFEVVGRDLIYSAALTHPFIRSRQSNLFGNISFDVRQTDVSSLRVKLYDDKLKVLRAGGSYDFVDGLAAINRIETTFSKGFNWDVDSNIGVRSRVNGEPDFFKGAATASRLQPISGPFDLYVSASGQWSSNALLSAEQFGLGGSAFGSAYDLSEITGDSGVAARAELQYSNTTDFKYLPNYQLYGFYDGGVVWTRAAPAATQSRDSLTSTGFGARFNISDPVSGGVEVAVPLTKYVGAYGADGHTPRVFFNLAYRY